MFIPSSHTLAGLRVVSSVVRARSIGFDVVKGRSAHPDRSTEVRRHFGPETRPQVRILDRPPELFPEAERFPAGHGAGNHVPTASSKGRTAGPPLRKWLISRQILPDAPSSIWKDTGIHSWEEGPNPSGATERPVTKPLERRCLWKTETLLVERGCLWHEPGYLPGSINPDEERRAMPMIASGLLTRGSLTDRINR